METKSLSGPHIVHVPETPSCFRVTSFLKKNLLFLREDPFSKGRQERLQRGILNPPWSLHIGSLWKIPFINPPEVQGQFLRQVVYGLFLMNRHIASRALQGVPVKYFPAVRAGSFFILLFYPFLGSMVFHELEIFHYFFVVPDSVHHMNFGKILQPLTREIAALEAPSYFFLLGATTKTVATVATSRVDIVGQASVATDFFDRDFVGFSHLPQFIQILILIGQVSGASSAVKTADSNQLIFSFFHRITSNF